MSEVGLASFGICRAKPGHSDELGRLMEDLLVPTRAEPGCLRYSLFHAKEQPDVWLLFEEWRSAEDLAAHVETPHMQTFIERSKQLIAEGPNSYPSNPVG